MCSFNLSAAESAFQGPFRDRDSPESIWRPVDADHSHFSCGHDDQAGDRLQVNSQQYQLMDRAVQPTTEEPLYKVSETVYVNDVHDRDNTVIVGFS